MSASRKLVRIVGVFALAIMMLGIATAAYAAVPTTPVLRDAWVSDVGKVSLRWDASTDASGHAVAYDIYRDVIPISSATIISRSLTPIVSNYVGITIQVNAAPAEATQSYVWYYAVAARDDQPTPLKSDPSICISPNVHGYRMDSNIVSCNRCHSTHGAYQVPYQSKELCYTCHGNTNAASTLGAKSSKNTQASFYDYTGQVAGSKHRNQYMIDNNKNCAACHSPHRSSYYYDTSGTYQASSSYRMMLRITYGTALYAYVSNNAAPATNNEACLGCHGATMVFEGKTITGSTSIALAGGPNAFANTAGDHNTAGYSASAHGNATIYSNDYPATNPGVQCEVCHDNHGSATTRLIDYRRSRTADANANKQAGLCFKCHSTSSTESKVAAGYAKPFSWNGRDVQAEFSRASHHPYATTTGSWVPTVDNTFAQTTQAEFDTDTLSNTQTTATSDGEITLAQYTTTITPPMQVLVYGSQGGARTLSSYDPQTSSWSTAPLDNTLWNPGSGSSAFFLNNKVYVTRAGGTLTQAVYDPATDSWTASQSLPTNIGAGGDSTINTTTADTCVYYSAAAGTSARIMWWNYTGTSTGQFNFQTAGTDRILGIGSAIAYAPDADRLFVIYQNGTAGDGGLYYRTDPARSTVDADFAAGPLVVSDSSTRYNRMTYFKVGGTEYLLILGRDTTDSRDTIVISNLAATPTKTDRNVDPFGGNSTGDGVSLQWDGGSYIYAIRGGSATDFRRALIPANPVTGTWTWETLSASFTQAAGSSIAAGLVQPADVTGLAYQLSGTATSPDILPYASAYKWGTVSWTGSEPAGTGLSVTVEGWNGGAWTTLANAVGTSSIDLSAFTVSAYSKIRLQANLSTSDNQATPVLSDWAATSIYDVYTTDQGSLTCANCHNVHYNQAQKAGAAWDMARASDPDNTKLTVSSTAYGSTAADFCMRCHDGASSPATTTATTLVPYSAAFGTVTAPYFPGWDKNASGYRFADSGHMAATTANGKALCETCHDPHASDNARLTAWTRPAGVTWAGGLSVAGSRVNTSTVAREENLCYKCHGNGTASYPRANGAKDVYTKSNLTYKHVMATYTGRHADTETASLLGGTNRHSECTDCHDAHVAKQVGGTALALHNGTSSKAGSAVYGAWGTQVSFATSNFGAPTGFTPVRLAGGANDYEAYLCFKCHSSNTSVPSGQTNIAQEFNPSNFSYHNVLGQGTGVQSSFTFQDSAGTTRNITWAVPTASTFLKSPYTTNSMVTCTDCHTNSQNAATQASGPHGSTVQWILDPGYTNWTTTTNLLSYSTTICGKCHTNLATSNIVHREHDDRGNSGGNCQLCHIKTPHGWKRPRLLGYTTDGTGYATTSQGLKAINPRTRTSVDDWNKDGDCQTGCSKHSSTITPYWP
ncbi:MAG: hypothetical protein CVT59_06665 [Actinobacteria bacterium HGW-Actinobacteria-1]|jgi:predicted CXXCH cytochrome family protein|nr:MAG: hypothetical protein CVT59_06665 [Actinobacteria bacterium HGW-Actinobacteria-1]